MAVGPLPLPLLPPPPWLAGGVLLGRGRQAGKQASDRFIARHRDMSELRLILELSVEKTRGRAWDAIEYRARFGCAPERAVFTCAHAGA